MEKLAGNLRVYIFENRAEMGKRAGAAAAEAIRGTIAKKGEANVMFAAAPSQNEVLEALCGAGGIDWGKVHAFHMDEYIGLHPSHPAGFGNFLRRAIFERLPFASVNLIDAGAVSPEEETKRYAAVLAAHPIDVCLCGIGENGHLAFNDPPVADFADPLTVKAVALDEVCRRQQVNDGCFADIEEVPTHAVTVTVPALIAAPVVICTVPSAAKADAVRDMLEGAISTRCPASILRDHTNAGLYLDKDSAKHIL